MTSQADQRVRVLFVNTKQQPPLGADTWVHLEIIRALDRSQFDVHAACVTGAAGRPTLTYQRLRDIPDVTIRKVNFGRELVGGSKLSKLVGLLTLVPAVWSLLLLAVYIRRNRISVIHTADRPREAFVCALLAWATGAKCVVHMHVGYDGRWMRGMLRWGIFHADVLIAVSQFVADTLIEAGRHPDSVHVVRNGIDIDRWHPGEGRQALRAELGIDEATPVVTTVCRLFPSKGTSELVRALHDIEPQVPDAELLVVGEQMVPGYADELNALAQRCGVSRRVRFLGRRNDVAAVLAATDVFAMPSFGEPFGLVYVEAMAMKLPVVALANGGTVEVVDDGVTGLLSAAGDAEGLAKSLGALLADQAQRAAFGDAGRDRAERYFTTEHMAANTGEVLASIASTATNTAGHRKKWAGK